MVYDSTISFTLDTICPWTYLARRRLQRALEQVRSSQPDSGTTFTLRYLPFQLYPEASKEGEDKYEWYRKSRYGDSEDKMKMYTTLMAAYGADAGIDFKFGGTVANTLDAHRVIQHFQENSGPEVADKIVESLYSQYFENEKHPSAAETLLRATTEAGIPESEARPIIDDESEGRMDVQMLIREQTGNGIDAVPHVVIEGRRRDVTLEGAREISEYVKALERVIKENA
ncbi:putative dsba oxidoreductase protein [Neofusicoccum parvum UCRNP2]|uniref:Putative dsba oxidoreductase protein n=1 Tax=Botryosphaeria parva (strain UCR-NP2) TaxID=1287680 RepID=R1GK34_BOTPV|nr:putative dsba oxidoreductase protein [Neofusicoccum parvum UCRNP2]